MFKKLYCCRNWKLFTAALPYIIDCNKTEIDDKNKERDYFAEIKAQKVEVQDWANRVHYGILENELLMGRLVVSLKTTAEFTRRLVLDLDKLDLEDIDEMIQLNDAFHPLSPKCIYNARTIHHNGYSYLDESSLDNRFIVLQLNRYVRS